MLKKLHKMYSMQHLNNQLSYESFRGIFENSFNIAFGYPRKDTCSTCDTFKAQLFSLTEATKTSSNDETRTKTVDKLANKSQRRELHLKKAERFCCLKKKYRTRSINVTAWKAITMDFQNKLPCPNITTNDVYYRRQLNFRRFNIHILSNLRSIFYTYDELIAKKGSGEVCSMLYHFAW